MGGHRQLASWLVARRGQIEGTLVQVLAEREATPPAPDSPESEALRRFRAYATSSLLRGGDAAPALDGLRVSERRTGRLLEGWLDAVARVAGPDGAAVRAILEPSLVSFRTALRTTGGARRASGAPRVSNRRAVSAAIDRVAEAFLAIETETGNIVDANPAAGALLGTTRDQLLGESALQFVPEPTHEQWWTQLDALAEGGDGLRFLSILRDRSGRAVDVEVSLTRFATRARTLALAIARTRGA